MNILAEGKADLITVFSGGLLSVGNQVTISKVTVNSTGSAIFNEGAILSGTLTLNNGGYAVITTSTGGVINLVDNTTPVYLVGATTRETTTSNMSGLVISGTGSATTVISGFTGDASNSITLANVHTSNVTNVAYPDVNHVTFTLNDGTAVTLNITGVGNYGYALTSDANGNLVYEICFLTGTMIEIPGSVCAVEDLKIGDSVLTYNPVTQGKVSKPVTWIGHKTASIKSNLLNDEAGYPVRILKDAIAPNVPNKDLLITAEHCLYFDGKFIPARMLVNGYSIYYDTSMTSYDYYHIETAEHSILTADGMLTESYLDTGNRHTFNLDHKVIKLSGNKVKAWQNDAIAPLVTERSIVERIYNYLLQRAHVHGCLKQEQPFELTQDPDLCLMTDQGEVIHKKASSTDKKLDFIIPNNVSAVWILSRTSRPCDVIGAFVDDRRYLGVLVGEVTLQRNGKKHPITTHLDADHLLGWDVKETIPFRWTKGKAFLPLTQLKCRSDKPNLLTLDILSDHAYIIDYSKENNKKLA
ncbi:Hint domain-containing protein [Commensalibacter intestini]|uniref:Hint domain-containing protein n=1 Tax=Commensalibacter intestini TaxID=479936 RepID=UPI000A36B6A3|nr:Hint domain-containing protein [Commensalibacter intestini]